jgi:hypothetical protein
MNQLLMLLLLLLLDKPQHDHIEPLISHSPSRHNSAYLVNHEPLLLLDQWCVVYSLGN